MSLASVPHKTVSVSFNPSTHMLVPRVATKEWRDLLKTYGFGRSTAIEDVLATGAQLSDRTIEISPLGEVNLSEQALEDLLADVGVSTFLRNCCKEGTSPQVVEFIQVVAHRAAQILQQTKASELASAANTQMHQDARRYQFLRSVERIVPDGQRELLVYQARTPFTDESDDMLFEKELDAAVDAAIAAQPNTNTL